jgi:hypothetical protein
MFVALLYRASLAAFSINPTGSGSSAYAQIG